MDAFVGIDPDDTIDVAFKGATVVVGVIPQGAWERIHSEMSISHRDAKRKAIASLRAAGLDPSEVLTTTASGNEVTRADAGAMTDPAHQERMFTLLLELSGWAVREHRNWNRRDGTPVPCVHQTRRIFGLDVQVLDPATLRHYSLHPALLDAIFAASKKLQELGDDAKKVSPPQR